MGTASPALRRTVAVAAAIVLLGASSAPAASRPLAAIRAEGTLRVGITGDYAPFSLREADGSIGGADVVMARSLAHALGVKLELVLTSWKGLAADHDADRFDIAMGGISVTPERAETGDFSRAVLSDGKRPIVRCADKDRYVTIAAIDRPEVRVAVNPGGTNERFARSRLTHAAITVHADNRSIFEEIAVGRADVMVTDGVEVDYQARRHPGVLCAALVPGLFDHTNKAFWMTRDPELKAAVDSWLGGSIASGEYDRALAAAA